MEMGTFYGKSGSAVLAVPAVLGLLLVAVPPATAASPLPRVKDPTRASARTGQTAPPKPAGTAASPAPATAPSDYVIGPDDLLAVVFWREKEMSAEVVVRPDGKITLPLINDIQAAGLTPEELRLAIEKAAERYIQDPNPSVVVKQINSRKVFVTGMVNKPGPYPLSGPTTVMQAIAMAGGLQEFAKKDRITILRVDGARTQTFKFNYKDVSQGRRVEQNILLKPGDTIVVP
jgi:polysaccharide export outer membrane protein